MLRIACAAALLATSTATAVAGAPANLDQLVAAPGLQRVKARAFDVAYVRPGASLAGYDSILLEPVDVSYSPGWNPYRTGSRLRVTAEERESLRLRVGQWVQQAFAQELQQGRMKLTDQPGPRVLRIKPRVVDLALNDTGVPTDGPTRVLTTASGEATLVAEFSDAASGELLARVGDWEELRDTVRVLRRSNPVGMQSDVEAVAANWGRTVREFAAAPAH